ncbi:GNAT family N-acetyltransferase [Bacillus halotolerans]|uniref:GNAT family N-acetyltransferase n=1 Tax=Bacillus halotolerans TaxID=260554 RepID=UPI00273AA87E|nr:GNAT family N-acetyltransferase [Bacillus halotolerans]MDP4524551.1 GNAT family N-acetyltransferase [Bacillus halotolerans]
MYDVIKLEREDWREVIRMSEYAFQKELSDEEREEKVKALENHYIIGIKEQEKLPSKLHNGSLFRHAGGAGDKDGRYCRGGNLA